MTATWPTWQARPCPVLAVARSTRSGQRHSPTGRSTPLSSSRRRWCRTRRSRGSSIADPSSRVKTPGRSGLRSRPFRLDYRLGGPRRRWCSARSCRCRTCRSRPGTIRRRYRNSCGRWRGMAMEHLQRQNGCEEKSGRGGPEGGLQHGASCRHGGGGPLRQTPEFIFSKSAGGRAEEQERVAQTGEFGGALWARGDMSFGVGTG